MNALLRSAAVLALALAALAASGQNLVQNGGFETGTFASRDAHLVGAANSTMVAAGAQHSGTYGAVLSSFRNNNAYAGQLTQSLITVPGSTYRFSYWLSNFGATRNGLETGPLSVLFEGTTVFSSSSFTTPVGFQLYSFGVTATSALTTIEFDYGTPGSLATGTEVYLDDVSVVANPTPEPSTWATLGLGGVAVLRRRKRA